MQVPFEALEVAEALHLAPGTPKSLLRVPFLGLHSFDELLDLAGGGAQDLVGIVGVLLPPVVQFRCTGLEGCVHSFVGLLEALPVLCRVVGGLCLRVAQLECQDYFP